MHLSKIAKIIKVEDMVEIESRITGNINAPTGYYLLTGNNDARFVRRKGRLR